MRFNLLVRPINLLEICAEPGKKKADLAGDRDDAAGHDIAGGSQARNSSETGTARLVVASPVEVQTKTSSETARLAAASLAEEEKNLRGGDACLRVPAAKGGLDGRRSDGLGFQWQSGRTCQWGR
jgi:hypothetical protein